MGGVVISDPESHDVREESAFGDRDCLTGHSDFPYLDNMERRPLGMGVCHRGGRHRSSPRFDLALAPGPALDATSALSEAEIAIEQLCPSVAFSDGLDRTSPQALGPSIWILIMIRTRKLSYTKV
jgi:hypothetical protein